jgi:hypothetical protein
VNANRKGAKYKGFFSVQECFEFIWLVLADTREQFPTSTFTKNDDGDYIMDNPEIVMKVVEEARQKKQKTSGVALSTAVQNENEWERLRSLYLADPKLELELDDEQQDALQMIILGKNMFISGAV